MHNLVYLIGRLVSDPELKTTENNKEYTTITLAVQRNFKNQDGIYETDFIKCSLWCCSFYHILFYQIIYVQHHP